MKRRIVVLGGSLVILAAASRGYAHHSFAATYDVSRVVKLDGVVKEFVWRNPHSYLRIDVTDDKGVTTTWALEWGSISQLGQATKGNPALTRTTLRPGDRLIVEGAPARDPSSLRLRINHVKRPADGWEWMGEFQ